SMNTYLGASRELAPSDIDEEKIARAKVLYIEGYLWDAPDAKAAINKAIAATKRAGHKVALTLPIRSVSAAGARNSSTFGRTIWIFFSPMRKRRRRCSKLRISMPRYRLPARRTASSR